MICAAYGLCGRARLLGSVSSDMPRYAAHQGMVELTWDQKFVRVRRGHKQRCVIWRSAPSARLSASHGALPPLDGGDGQPREADGVHCRVDWRQVTFLFSERRYIGTATPPQLNLGFVARPFTRTAKSWRAPPPPAPLHQRQHHGRSYGIDQRSRRPHGRQAVLREHERPAASGACRRCQPGSHRRAGREVAGVRQLQSPRAGRRLGVSDLIFSALRAGLGSSGTRAAALAVMYSRAQQQACLQRVGRCGSHRTACPVCARMCMRRASHTFVGSRCAYAAPHSAGDVMLGYSGQRTPLLQGAAALGHVAARPSQAIAA